MTFRNLFPILSLIASLFCLATPAMAQSTPPQAVFVAGGNAGPSDPCMAGVVPLIPGQLSLTFPRSCIGRPGFYTITNHMSWCYEPVVNGKKMIVTRETAGGGMEGTGVYAGPTDFRQCLAPGETAMFWDSPTSVRLTGVAWTTSGAPAVNWPTLTVPGGIPAAVGNSVSLGPDGVPRINGASVAAGSCGGSSHPLGADPSRDGNQHINIFPFQCQ